MIGEKEKKTPVMKYVLVFSVAFVQVFFLLGISMAGQGAYDNAADGSEDVIGTSAAKTSPAVKPDTAEKRAAPVPQAIVVDDQSYENGPIINSTGTGVGGADESVLKNLTLSMGTLGYACDMAEEFRVADDFTVENRLKIEKISVYAYQVGAPVSPASISSINMRIWDGPPSEAESAIVWGDDTTNRMESAKWYEAYRVTESKSGTSDERAIVEVLAKVETEVDPGTYWIDYQISGEQNYSEAWCLPIAASQEITTGNALHYFGVGETTGWRSLDDQGTDTSQGLSFKINPKPVYPLPLMVPPVIGPNSVR